MKGTDSVDNPTSGGGCRVKLADGRLVTGDVVLCAVPLGVLKAGSIHLTLTLTLCAVPLGVLKAGSIEFKPSLPDRKQNVIDRLGFGVINKVALEWEAPFWPKENDFFGIVRYCDEYKRLPNPNT